jgi:hypothetical protein
MAERHSDAPWSSWEEMVGVAQVIARRPSAAIERGKSRRAIQRDKLHRPNASSCSAAGCPTRGRDRDADRCLHLQSLLRPAVSAIRGNAEAWADRRRGSGGCRSNKGAPCMQAFLRNGLLNSGWNRAAGPSYPRPSTCGLRGKRARAESVGPIRTCAGPRAKGRQSRPPTRPPFPLNLSSSAQQTLPTSGHARRNAGTRRPFSRHESTFASNFALASAAGNSAL